MITKEQLELDLLHLIHVNNIGQVPENPITDPLLCTLREDLDIDSLAAAELTMFIEEKWKVEITFQEYVGMKTLSDLVDMIHSRIK